MSSATGTTPAVDPDGDGDGGQRGAQLSKFGQFMSKMQSLEQTDPATAKQVLSTIASKLGDEAKSATGDKAQRLSALASKFQAAAQTGDLSALQPTPAGQTQGAQGQGTSGGHHHHHGGHHKAMQSYAAQDGSSSPLDTMMSVLDSATSSSSTTAT